MASCRATTNARRHSCSLRGSSASGGVGRKVEAPVVGGRILPDGRVDLVWSAEAGLLVAGPQTQSLLRPFTAPFVVVGARFHPGAAPPALGVPASESDRRTCRALFAIDGKVAAALSEIASRKRARRLSASLRSEPFLSGAPRVSIGPIRSCARLPPASRDHARGGRACRRGVDQRAPAPAAVPGGGGGMGRRHSSACCASSAC